MAKNLIVFVLFLVVCVMEIANTTHFKVRVISLQECEWNLLAIYINVQKNHLFGNHYSNAIHALSYNSYSLVSWISNIYVGHWWLSYYFVFIYNIVATALRLWNIGFKRTNKNRMLWIHKNINKKSDLRNKGFFTDLIELWYPFQNWHCSAGMVLVYEVFK